MGKNKRNQISHRDQFHNIDVECDSIEECDFIEWCSEAANLGIIQDYEYQPQPIKLFDSVEYVNFDKKKRVLLRDHIYSPDFCIKFIPKASRILCKAFKLSLQDSQAESFQVYLDIKGTFQRNDGGRAFSINQKWVFQKTGIYIVKVVPKDFFKVCGCPQSCFLTKKTNKPRKAYQGCQPLEQVFNAKK